MSDQPRFLSQTSGPPGSVHSSQNVPRSPASPPLGPPPGSVYHPQMPNSSIYQPQQQAQYGGTSTQSAQPPSSHQTPPFPTSFVQGYPPTNALGPPQQSTPPRAVTMPLPEIRREPRSVTGGGERHVDARVCDDEQRAKSPGNRPAYGGTGSGGSNGCCCTVV